MKRILIATDSYKGSLSSKDVGEIINSAFLREGFGENVVLPVSDGGDGMTEAVKEAVGGEIVNVSVKGPMFDEVSAEYVLLGKTAIIESSRACGLSLVPEKQRDVMNATTYGVGQMIAHALSKGAENIIIGLGGSATNDGGTGMAAALGVKFYGDYPFIPVGRTLENIKRIDKSGLDKRLLKANIVACCDVDSPFCGKKGAAFMFAGQKGASAEEIKRLDAGLAHLASLIPDINLKKQQGSGAAGGLGGGIVAFLGGTLKRGFDVMSGLIGLEDKIKMFDMVITGEGKTDVQTLTGKLPSGIAALCKKHGKECIIISGCVEGDISPLFDAGVSAVYPTVEDVPKKTPSQMDAADALYRTALKVAKEIKAR